ncbi:MAG: bifunctional phosphoglucose/phosphomannose isomerase [Actinobacteria bacterium]|nr:bifunctional phosphoglucose/phosphomannose isomerase [Actinomycetota bacterium]MBW3646833.1 bifunctional phosphoglucose/phosphomannose isomerase [Actinomycetota bacterium]
MLPAVASSAAQVREAAVLAVEAGVASLAADGRPRAVVICGMGGSGIAGDILGGLAGLGSPVPILTHRGYGLPAWVGPVDLVVAVSCSGSTEEPLSALEEAVRRGCRLLVVGRSGSPLDDLGQRGRAVFVPVTQGRQPRASIWALSTPLIVAGHALGLLHAPVDVVEAAAVTLEQVAGRCRPDADSLVNPAKRLALDLDGTLPVVWGASPLTASAAYRFACQLNENAKLPAVWGVLPEADHNQVTAFDGPFAGSKSSQNEDFFADREQDGPDAAQLALVLLRDGEEHPQVARRAEVSAEMARERGVPVVQLLAEGDSALSRLASLVGLADYATTYLALLQGIDPSPVDAITSLKQRIAPPMLAQ